MHSYLNLQLILYAGFADVKSERPSYPSSKTKVDWDKLESEVKKEVISIFYLSVLESLFL